MLHGKKEVFIEDDREQKDNDKEKEANKFATDMLIPRKDFNKLIANGKPSLARVKEFAEKIQIAPGIIIGRLQHEKIFLFSQGNKLKQPIKINK